MSEIFDNCLRIFPVNVSIEFKSIILFLSFVYVHTNFFQS